MSNHKFGRHRDQLYDYWNSSVCDGRDTTWPYWAFGIAAVAIVAIIAVSMWDA